MMRKSEIEQLAEAFGTGTAKFLADMERKVELARAMQDREMLIKEQIKIEVVKSMRQIFEANYKRITGSSAWN
jgi:hypothetical protein